MLTKLDIEAILGLISFRDWTCYLGEKNGVMYLQWQFMAPDTDTPNGEKSLQKGRKWQLSKHMTAQEIERTAFLACEQAVLHEMCEEYTFLGQQIRNPHIDPYRMAKLMRDEAPLVTRDESTFTANA